MRTVGTPRLFGAIMAGYLGNFLIPFGVGEERALAMVLSLQVGSRLSVAAFGAIALWRSGVSLADLPGRREYLHEHG